MHQRTAFSLVELSIVLVILGLLVGGVLSGQSLIRAAELRSVSTDYSRYRAAMGSFRDKYFAMPGDMTNAQSFWGVDTGGCPGTNATGAASATTCNGDGDGTLSLSVATSNEPYRFWQHLAAAGLIEGSYTGVSNSTTANAIASSTTLPNVPKGRISGSHWMAYGGVTRLISDTALFDGSYGTVLMFTTGTSSTGVILKPEEAWNIDTKLDDGKPGTGIVTSRKDTTEANATTGCSDTAYTTATSIAATSNYLLSNTALACALIMKTGF